MLGRLGVDVNRERDKLFLYDTYGQMLDFMETAGRIYPHCTSASTPISEVEAQRRFAVAAL